MWTSFFYTMIQFKISLTDLSKYMTLSRLPRRGRGTLPPRESHLNCDRPFYLSVAPAKLVPVPISRQWDLRSLDQMVFITRSKCGTNSKITRAIVQPSFLWGEKGHSLKTIPKSTKWIMYIRRMKVWI